MKYIVDFQVRPSENHPSRDGWKHGILSILLESDSQANAVARATAIVKELPFDFFEEVRVRIYDPAKLVAGEKYSEEGFRHLGVVFFTCFTNTFGENEQGWPEPFRIV